MSNPSTRDGLYFEAHIFCCTNEREPGNPLGSCKARGGEELREYMKARSKELGLTGRVRVNAAGCLARCSLGPCIVIYPEGVWYTYHDKADVDEILDRHILGGEVVERLVLQNDRAELPAHKLELRVANCEMLTPVIRRLELVAANGGSLPPFKAGAHINLVTGVGVTRSYSLAGDPANTDFYEIAVKLETDGAGASKWILESLDGGDTLEASLPTNNFMLSSNADHHVLIAGGIGITPLLSMARQLKRAGASFALHYCARDADEAAFTDAIENEFPENATFHYDGGNAANGINLDSVLGGHDKGAHLYVCGPTGLMDSVIEKAADLSWPDARIHHEFFRARAAPKDQVDESFSVRLASSGRELAVPADKSILDVLRDNDIATESACEGGACGTCRTGLVSGHAEHRDDVLSNAEKAANGDIMLCVSRAKAGEVLTLDL